MKHLPLTLSLTGRHVLVAGGGAVAARKIKVLLNAGAKLQVVAPNLSEKLLEMAHQGLLSWREGAFAPSDIDSPFLIIAATNDRNTNAQIADLADAREIPVNVADNAERCSFFLPSLVDRSPVSVAISTGGSSPYLARYLRHTLASTIPGRVGELADFVAHYRPELRNNIPDIASRRKFWHEVIEGRIGELVLAGKTTEAKRAITTLMTNYDPEKSSAGEVYLVGAGPGDPDLLTLKALRIMQKADVILHDRLVSPEILAMCSQSAEKIYVGKRKDNHSVPQEKLNQMLVRLAQEGKRVCRLKGGDPFIFGRGGEEIDQLASAGIQFQIVPGITAASGCASYAGIPLTHRDHAQIVSFITGHQTKNKHDWQQLCQPNQTLVIYMGLDKLDQITTQLIDHGMRPDMPAALIEQGTTSNQRVHTGTIGNLLKTVKQANVLAPTIIIIGTVVTLHNHLGWFEERSHKPASIFSSGSEE